MNSTPIADFSFTHFSIDEFTFKSPSSSAQRLSVAFGPSGVFVKESHTFLLTLKFRAFQLSPDDELTEEGESVIEAQLVAHFDIPDAKSIGDVPDYFYMNSIAIVFPYLRAFITSITAMSGNKPIILPLMNLQALEGPLREESIEE